MSARDITDALREWCEQDHDRAEGCVHCDAFDEIERLRVQLEDLRRYCATGETP